MSSVDAPAPATEPLTCSDRAVSADFLRRYITTHAAALEPAGRAPLKTFEFVSELIQPVTADSRFSWAGAAASAHAENSVQEETTTPPSSARAELLDANLEVDFGTATDFVSHAWDG
jgi:hypothetical protein